MYKIISDIESYSGKNVTKSSFVRHSASLPGLGTLHSGAGSEACRPPFLFCGRADPPPSVSCFRHSDSTSTIYHENHLN